MLIKIRIWILQTLLGTGVIINKRNTRIATNIPCPVFPTFVKTAAAKNMWTATETASKKHKSSRAQKTKGYVHPQFRKIITMMFMMFMMIVIFPIIIMLIIFFLRFRFIVKFFKFKILFFMVIMFSIMVSMIVHFFAMTVEHSQNNYRNECQSQDPADKTALLYYVSTSWSPRQFVFVQ